MTKLTKLTLDAIKLEQDGETIRDEGGLLGRIRAKTSGISVSFYYRFRWESKSKDISCGTWPADSLAAIRTVRDEYRKLIASGINPADQKKIIKLDKQEAITARLEEAERQHAENLTVQDLFDEWVGTTDRIDKGAELRRLFTRDVLPKVGTKPLKTITEKHMLGVLGAVVDRGSDRMAVMLLSDLKQMFRWAEKRRPWKKLIEDNPVEHLEAKKITSDDYEGTERTRTLSAEEVSELSKKLPEAGLLRRTELCMWIMLSCCCRIGEIIKARWESVDLEAGIWTIPKENAKNKVEHTIYLSDFAMAYLRELRQLSGDSAWCLPRDDDTDHVCIKSATKQVRDRQLSAQGRTPMKNRSKRGDALLLSGGDWVPHDLRRTGATIMQSLGVIPDVVERCLNHVEPNKLRRTYQTYDYANEKREAWRLLGDRLTLILNSVSNVVLLRSA
jgi:integrase